MKMEMSITKKDHVNIGDFSNVNPNITLTLKDVDVEDSDEIYDLLSQLCDAYFNLEFIQSVEEMENLVNVNKHISLFKEEAKKEINFEYTQEIIKKLKQFT